MLKRALLIVFILLVLFASTALAMGSTHYRIDWFTVDGRGGVAQSAHYRLELTVGQNPVETEVSSSQYQACLGYWCGIWDGFRILSPLILR